MEPPKLQNPEASKLQQLMDRSANLRAQADKLLKEMTEVEKEIDDTKARDWASRTRFVE